MTPHQNKHKARRCRMCLRRGACLVSGRAHHTNRGLAPSSNGHLYKAERGSVVGYGRSDAGSIIIYAMLTMSAMLAIGLTLNSLFLGKLKSAAAARDSVVALYVADSAVEKCLFEARQNSDQSAMQFTSGTTYTVVNIAGAVDVTNLCSQLGSSSFQFRATGTYHGVRRALEISQ